MLTYITNPLYDRHFPDRIRIPVPTLNDNERQNMNTAQDLKMEISLIYQRLRNLSDRDCNAVLVHIKDQQNKIVAEINAKILKEKR